MKYIRTKDGIFEIIPEIMLTSLPPQYPTKQGIGVRQDSVIKQADTIEELCDGFWWENEMHNEPIFIPNYGLVLDRVKAWKESDKELNDNSFDRITIYGSVYIHGYGWKHICKVNKNKGELELL